MKPAPPVTKVLFKQLRSIADGFAGVESAHHPSARGALTENERQLMVSLSGRLAGSERAEAGRTEGPGACAGVVPSALPAVR